MPDSPYRLRISLNVLNHLGLNLYSNIPAVLSEAIANAWDADAGSVDVRFDIDAGTITIRDDGRGMDRQDINGKYLNVGYQKRSGSAKELTTPLGRKPMGRKGIGKLSLFSIANEVRVYSLKEHAEGQAFLLDARKIRQAIQGEDFSQAREYEPEQIEFDEVTGRQGTVIRLSSLKKLQRTSQTVRALKTRLARRFDLADDNMGFEIRVNGEAVTFSDRDYFHKARFLFQYGDYDYSRHCNRLDTEEDGVPLAFSRPVRFDQNGDHSDSGDFEISGWIAIAKHSNDLDSKGDDDNLNRISILVRKRVAQEDILQEFRMGGMFTKYVFGEIHADFLDEDDRDDIATSGRQRISEDDERYKALKQFVDSELRHIWNRTNRLKENRGMERAREIPVIGEWYDGLGSDSKSEAKRLFGRIDQIATDEEHRKTLYKHGVLAFEHLRHKEKLSQLETLDMNNLEAAVRLFSELDDIEASWYHQITLGRLDVIRKLRQHVDDDALEMVIQKHVYNHLWLMDPSWDRATETAHLERSVTHEFGEVSRKLSPEERNGRIDIRYKKISGSHVIIELKRSSVRMHDHELMGQVGRYMIALRKQLENAGEGGPVEAICLIGKNLHEWDDRAEKERSEKSLAQKNIRVVTYRQLIKDAETSYRNYLDKTEDKGRIKRILDEIDNGPIP